MVVKVPFWLEGFGYQIIFEQKSEIQQPKEARNKDKEPTFCQKAGS